MIRYIFLTLAICLPICARAEVGIYITKDDLPITSTKNITVVSKDGEKTVLTILSQYQAESKNFAYIVPVSATINENSVRTIDPRLVHSMLSYSSPRVAEYYDFDPCEPSKLKKRMLPQTKSFQTIGDNYALGLNYSDEKEYTDYKFTIFKEDKHATLRDYLSKRGYKLPETLFPTKNNGNVSHETFVILEAENSRPGWLKPLQFEINTRDLALDIYNSPNNTASSNFLIFITKNGELTPQDVSVKNLPTNVIIGTSAPQNMNNFIENLLMKNTSSNEFSMIYSWPYSACKPCVNPMPSIDDLRELGVFWYDKPEKGRYGVIAPFAAIHITAYFYTNLDRQVRFATIPSQDKYQALYKIYEPIDEADSSCKGNFASLLEKASKEFVSNKSPCRAILSRPTINIFIANYIIFL